MGNRTNFSSIDDFKKFLKNEGVDTRNMKIVSGSSFALDIGHNGHKVYHPYNLMEWGGLNRAYQAFVTRRDSYKLKSKKIWNRKGREANCECEKKEKGSTGIPGICRKIETDKRFGTQTLKYEVHYNDSSGKSKRKKFTLSMNKYSADDELHLFLTAKIFRHHYEFCNEADLEFNSEIYSNWKNEKLYEKGLPGIIAKYHGNYYDVK
ncbi:MAG: hypothetical protein KC589_04510 [Nanoarchaeota archaeon]|nr:hypothetical protein [Nanoarchaeota archaeon]